MNIFNFVKSHVHITYVVGEYTSLKRAGGYFKGRCPFHHEKTASFTVSPHKDIFYCFGCHIGGDVISFIAKIENYNQREAALFLADRYQIKIPQEFLTEYQSPEKIDNKDRHARLHSLIAHRCHELLKSHPQALSYLEKRGVLPGSIDQFAIGYFPSGLSNIKQMIELAKQHNFLLDDLLHAHILCQAKQVIFSPFEDRILFPIKDQLGRFCGFGGRTFRPGDERPKYYNSKETDYFSKGSLLFGFDLAKKAIHETGTVFLVEGYLDCILMAQYGYINTVATLGTACTPAHLKLLSRYAHHLYVLYDGDEAGSQAALRLTQLCWQSNMELQIISLPTGYDPASFCAEKRDLAPCIDRAQDIFVHFIDMMGKQFYQLTLHEKVAKVRSLIELIRTIDDPLKQDMLLDKAAKTFDIPFGSLQTELVRASPHSKGTRPQEVPIKNQEPLPEPPDTLAGLEKKIFSAIVNNVNLLLLFDLQSAINFMPTPFRELLLKVKDGHDRDGSFSFPQFFDTLTQNEKRYVSRLLLEHDQPLSVSAFEQLVLELYKKQWKTIVHEVKVKLTRATLEGDHTQISQITSDFLSIKRHIISSMNSLSLPGKFKESKH